MGGCRTGQWLSLRVSKVVMFLFQRPERLGLVNVEEGVPILDLVLVEESPSSLVPRPALSLTKPAAPQEVSPVLEERQQNQVSHSLHFCSVLISCYRPSISSSFPHRWFLLRRGIGRLLLLQLLLLSRLPW